MDVCSIPDTHLFLGVILVYILFSFVMSTLVYCQKCRVAASCSASGAASGAASGDTPTADDEFKSYRNGLTEYMGRYPKTNFFVTSILILVCCLLSMMSPCLTMKQLSIDQDMENYIKSENAETDNYDSLLAAVKQQEASGTWDSGRRLSGDERARGRARGLSDRYTGSVTLVYILANGKRPGNVFTAQNLRTIRDFEKEVLLLPDYSSVCRKKSFYTNDPADAQTCAEATTAITNWFFDTADDGTEALLDVDKTLETMAKSGVVAFMDVFFSLDYRQSNLTRSTFYVDAPSKSELQEFFTKSLVPLAKKHEGFTSEYRIVYYDNKGFLFGWDLEIALFNDARWSGLAFFAVFLFVWMHTRSLFISFFGMLGVTASIPITLWIYKDVLGIEHVSILNFLAMFVIMGIG
jgi:hypothetical protein